MRLRHWQEENVVVINVDGIARWVLDRNVRWDGDGRISHVGLGKVWLEFRTSILGRLQAGIHWSQLGLGGQVPCLAPIKESQITEDTIVPVEILAVWISERSFSKEVHAFFSWTIFLASRTSFLDIGL